MTVERADVVTLPGDLIFNPARSQDAKTAVVMTKHDWRRLKQKAQAIQPVIPYWGFFAALFAGGMVACGANYLVALAATHRDPSALWVNGGLTLLLFSLGVVCFTVDAQQRRSGREDAEELLREMRWIEEANPGTFPVVQQRA